MKWDISLSGISIRTNQLISTNPADPFLLQVTSTEDEGFFSSTHVLARTKIVDIYEFLYDLDVLGCILGKRRSLVIVHVKDARTNPHSIMQRFLGCE